MKLTTTGGQVRSGARGQHCIGQSPVSIHRFICRLIYCYLLPITIIQADLLCVYRPTHDSPQREVRSSTTGQRAISQPAAITHPSEQQKLPFVTHATHAGLTLTVMANLRIPALTEACIVYLFGDASSTLGEGEVWMRVSGGESGERMVWRR